MENLAGNDQADVYIQEELLIAGIDVVKAETHRSEVPYTLAGKLGSWTLTRAWYYWIANAANGKGLTLGIANELHNSKYPVTGEHLPKTYGEVIRVEGHCCSPPPEYGATKYDTAGRQLLVDPTGEAKAGWEDTWKKGMLKETEGTFHFVSSLEGVVAKSVVDFYHIDTQLGLNEFARVVKSTL